MSLTYKQIFEVFRAARNDEIGNTPELRRADEVLRRRCETEDTRYLGLVSAGVLGFDILVNRSQVRSEAVLDVAEAALTKLSAADD